MAENNARRDARTAARGGRARPPWQPGRPEGTARGPGSRSGAPARAGAPLISRAEGGYLYAGDGKQYLDWTSQAVCTNLGYTVPQQVQDAVHGG